MRRLTLLLGALVLPALADEMPVTDVVMSSGGLMQVERRATLAPDAAASFRVPVEAVDDVLKSLVVRDPAGTVEAVRLPARDLAAEAFRGLPLRPADFESRGALLNALRGQVAEAAGATGRIAEAAEVEGGLRLALVTPGGLVTVVLRDGAEVRLADAALAARVARAAEALATARSDGERLVEVVLRGTRAREVGVVSVVPAPVWKPSWRLVVPAASGPARLQGWATVENLSGADWAGVRLTLVSGEAASLHQALYDPIRVPRPELPVRVAEGVSVLADTGGRPPPPPPLRRRAAEPPAMAMAMAAPSPAPMGEAAPMAEAAAPALAAASAGRIAFALPAPVTVGAGMTANLPFLDAALPAERVWWIQDLSARHPLQAVSLVNGTAGTLPDGVVTVFGADGAEAGAWLGDAELRALPPGATRLLAFGRDRDVLVTAATHGAVRPVGAALRPGQVVLRTVSTEEVALAIDPRGARGTVLIDLARRPGAAPRFPVAAEGDFGLRHRAALDGATTIRLPFEREGERVVTLWDAGLGDPLLLDWRRLEGQPALRRLPGGPGTLEALRTALEELPEGAPGRAALARVVGSLAEARRLLDAFVVQWRGHATAEAALARARSAAEDRSGPAREEARRTLNRVSQEAEGAGARADAAWEAWQRAVGGVLAAAPG